MRILIFNWRDPSHPWAGGAEVFLHQVARRWVRQGHPVTWFCGRYEGQPARGCLDGSRIIRQGGIFGVYVRAAQCYLGQLRGRFDVILDSANGIPFFTPLFSNIPKLAMVHHVHDRVFFRELPRHLAHLGCFLEQWCMPRFYRDVPFITVSNSSRDALVRLGIPPAQISTLYNAVDHTRYRPGLKSKTPLLVYLGRLRHYKSIDVALRALPAVLRVVPDLRFSIAGSGLAETSLRALTRQLGLTDHVRFHGHVSDREKIRLLQQAHVTVNPSMKEGWGLTVLEANACGTPVVGANVAGLCDSIRHGETGLLVPYADPQALAACLQELLTDHDRRQEMSRNALAWAGCFHWDETAERGLELLARCCDGRNGR